MSEPILIWGAGAIGGTLGAAFIRAGHDVVFVDSEADHVAAINAQGLRIAGPIFRGHRQGAGFRPGRSQGHVRPDIPVREGAAHARRRAGAAAASCR